jgi:imidazolonepropionase-like amidohydrolase
MVHKIELMKRTLILCMFIAIAVSARSQTAFPVKGVGDERPSMYAFTNATVIKKAGSTLMNATLVINEGKVISVGTGIAIPKNAIVIDLQGKYVYPAFIDPYTSYGLPEEKSSRNRQGSPQFDSKKEGAFGWNEAIKAEYAALNEFTVDAKTAGKWRKAGFGAVLSHKMDGIHRGSSVFVQLSDAAVQEVVLNPSASAHLSFDKGTSNQEYPSSIMGMSALLRQTFIDAEWYATKGKLEQTNQSLQAVNDLKRLPHVFEANNDKLRALLADRIGDEFGMQFIIKGNGDEYQRLDEIKKTNASFIVPLNFPEAYDLSDPLASLEVSYADLKHWELAPHNAKMLASSGVRFAFTAQGLDNPADYLDKVRAAVEAGLSQDDAIKAMTETPAALVGMSGMVGSLNVGMMANFIITSDALFADKKPVIFQSWVGGSKYELEAMDEKDRAGKYQLSVADASFDFVIEGKAGKYSAKVVVNDTTNVKATIKFEGSTVMISFIPDGSKSELRLSGWMTADGFKGTGIDTEENWVEWSAERTGDNEKEEEKKAEEKSPASNSPGAIVYPFVAHGWEDSPKQEEILFKNATVWTMEAEGVLENTDVLIAGGKILKVGKDLTTNGKTVDATGLHLTPGIIDEHSHTALSGVNEGSHAITAEVEMYDAVDSEDINIYRQLSGGVTAAQLLHGSANPVGGQSALIKFRWGKSPEEMFVKGADGFIKFALGENVKQANWGDNNTIRFPQTRMGVEQVFIDGFTRAREYDESWKAYNALSKKAKMGKTPPRRDLQLETLAEIVNKERFITCHSYIQSEINMLMKVAEAFDFNVNTFTHILEGYKVADKMAAHGAGGSTFSDWWAYKFEVKDAIPYNAALMAQAGVTVAINSDDSEMARRLNQEAAKSVKYGGMDEYEAMKMVTINPAKLLHLDDRMGSVMVGKDADLVLWTAHPLSISAKSRMTLVDGIPYFDLEKDLKLREGILAEKARIIALMKDVKAAGGKTEKYTPKERHIWDCEEFIIEE